VAVRLRLMRLGRKGQPFYRIVAVDSRKKRDGAYIEKIGHYNPLRRPAELVMDEEKALKWLSEGAIPSDTVRNLFSKQGVMMAFDLQKRGMGEEEIKDKVARFRMEKEEKLKALEEAAIAEQAKKMKTQPPAKVESEDAVKADKETETTVEESTEVKAESEEADAVTETAVEKSSEAEVASEETVEAKDTAAETTESKDAIEEPGEAGETTEAAEVTSDAVDETPAEAPSTASESENIEEPEASEEQKKPEEKPSTEGEG